MTTGVIPISGGYQPSMDVITMVLLIAAIVCFVLAAFGVGGRINLVAAGLACWALSALVPAL